MFEKEINGLIDIMLDYGEVVSIYPREDEDAKPVYEAFKIQKTPFNYNYTQKDESYLITLCKHDVDGPLCWIEIYPYANNRSEIIVDMSNCEGNALEKIEERYIREVLKCSTEQ